MVASAPILPRIPPSPSSGRRLRVVLIGNYFPDSQESMQRFRNALFNGLRRNGCHVESLAPQRIVGRWAKSTTQGFGKWLGYIDKYVIFPSRLRKAIAARAGSNDEFVVAHIC